MALKAFQPISFDVEIVRDNKPETIEVSFVGSPPDEAVRYMNGVPEGEETWQALEAFAANDLTEKVAKLLPEQTFLFLALQTKYRLRLKEVAAAITRVDKDEAPKS